MQFEAMKREFGLEAIELADHHGSYRASTVVAGHFVWSLPRKIEIDCPMFKWIVGGKRFGGVVPVTFERNGTPDNAAILASLRSMIAESTVGANA